MDSGESTRPISDHARSRRRTITAAAGRARPVTPAIPAIRADPRGTGRGPDLNPASQTRRGPDGRLGARSAGHHPPRPRPAGDQVKIRTGVAVRSPRTPPGRSRWLDARHRTQAHAEDTDGGDHSGRVWPAPNQTPSRYRLFGAPDPQHRPCPPSEPEGPTRPERGTRCPAEPPGPPDTINTTQTILNSGLGRNDQGRSPREPKLIGSATEPIERFVILVIAIG